MLDADYQYAIILKGDNIGTGKTQIIFIFYYSRYAIAIIIKHVLKFLNLYIIGADGRYTYAIKIRGIQYYFIRYLYEKSCPSFIRRNLVLPKGSLVLAVLSPTLNTYQIIIKEFFVKPKLSLSKYIVELLVYFGSLPLKEYSYKQVDRKDIASKLGFKREYSLSNSIIPIKQIYLTIYKGLLQIIFIVLI